MPESPKARPHDAAWWLRKAAALLLPSPFAALDPGGEAGRTHDLAECLPKPGGPLGLEHDELRDACAMDAYNAHLGIPGEHGPSRPGPFVLRHPLSAEELTPALAPTPDLIAQLHSDLLARLRKPDLLSPSGTDAGSWYRHLWFALQDWAQQREHRAVTARLPGSLEMPDCTVWALRTATAALLGARTADPKRGRAALLYLHVGPVQGFIEAARRTHDLWVGSFLVAFLALQGVLRVARLVGPDAVVYPDPAFLPLAHWLLDGNSADGAQPSEALLQSALPNRVLSVVPEGEAEEIARQTGSEVRGAWRNVGEDVRSWLRDCAQSAARAALGTGGTGGTGETADPWPLFDAQIGDHVECDAVVQPWPETQGAMRDVLDRLGGAAASAFEVTDRASGRTGHGYGRLFDLTHRVLGAHRRTVFPAPIAGAERDKCVQCGAREQVGPAGATKRQLRLFWTELSRAIQQQKGQSELPADKRPPGRLSLHLKDGERLCAVCLTKRLAPEAFIGGEKSLFELSWARTDHRRLLRFPSVATIASAPWRYLLCLRAEKPRVKKWLDSIRELCDKLDWTPPGALLPELERRFPTLTPALRGDQRSGLAVDGAWFYDRAYEAAALWSDHYGRRPQLDEVKGLAALPDAWKGFKQTCAELGSARPSAYFAVVAMDGDEMGKWLTGRHERTPKVRDVYAGIESETDPEWMAREWAARPRALFPALHGELSRRLARLATGVIPDLVGQYLGRAVYCGGDDVLALLPLQTALPCAARIRRAFRQREHVGAAATISAGICVTHIMEPLGEALTSARKALQEAKNEGRDRVTVRIEKRSGAPLQITLPWQVTGPDGKSLEISTALRRLLVPVRDASGRERCPIMNEGYAVAREAELLAPDAAARAAASASGGGAAGSGREDPLLRAAFKSRLRFLLGVGPEYGNVFEALWQNGGRVQPPEAGGKNLPMPVQAMTDLLMVLRFFLREEHGIRTAALLECLEEGRP